MYLKIYYNSFYRVSANQQESQFEQYGFLGYYFPLPACIFFVGVWLNLDLKPEYGL